MVGTKRLNNVRHAVETVIREKIQGDFIETGVWRGGVCIFIRGMLAAYGIKDRNVLVADSFRGLPPPEADCLPDADDPHHTYTQLAISLEQVKANFDAYGLLDSQVEFIEGWFSDTLPLLTERNFSVIRLDGDMYASTIVALNSLYPSLSSGGFCIIDDYGAVEGCRIAVDEFRERNNITAEMVKVDWTGVWWRK
jgi:O-methyltransferase